MWVYTILSAKLCLFTTDLRTPQRPRLYTVERQGITEDHNGKKCGRNNHNQISGITPAVALNDREKPPEKSVATDGGRPLRHAGQSDALWAPQRSATLLSMNRRTDALSAKICVIRHTVFVAIVINVASAGTNCGKRRTPYVNSPNTPTVHAMEAWTRSRSITPLILNLDAG